MSSSAQGRAPAPVTIPVSGRKFLIKYCVSLVVFGLPLFGGAGTMRWWNAWAYIALIGLFSWLTWFMLRRYSPDLLAERSRVHPDSKKWDRWLASIIAGAGQLAILVVAGLDERLQWTGELPFWEEGAGFAIAFAAAAFMLWCMLVNRFFSTMVRIQTERGHVVIDSGPYAFVRHPGYTGWAVFLIATPLALGSLNAVWAAAACLVLLVIRTALEDATLRRELAGYQAYAARVRFRLIPFLW